MSNDITTAQEYGAFQRELEAEGFTCEQAFQMVFDHWRARNEEMVEGLRIRRVEVSA